MQRDMQPFGIEVDRAGAARTIQPSDLARACESPVAAQRGQCVQPLQQPYRARVDAREALQSHAEPTPGLREHHRADETAAAATLRR
ncbi:MAG: hypothetical protein ACK559_26950, partial [bacterium]